MKTRYPSLLVVSLALACTAYVDPGDTTTATTTATEASTTTVVTEASTASGTEASTTAATEETGAPGPLGFAVDVYAPILMPNCGCHRSGEGGLTMGSTASSAYEALYRAQSFEVPAGMDRVHPGNPSTSYLFHKIRGTHLTVGGMGMAMPLGDPLSDDQVEVIKQWIVEGALP